MEHPVLNRIRREGFQPLGWFEPDENDGVAPETRFIVLLGNAGPDMFNRFSRERNLAEDQIDDWTRHILEPVAQDLGASVVFPFDVPAWPFLTWAKKAGAGHASPLGLNIHPTYGLWHAYRAAFLFTVAFDLPYQSKSAHPCNSCSDRPCLTACPVNAFDGQSYDVVACGRHILSDKGLKCMSDGCMARLACPVGKTYTYGLEQRQFHMRAFQNARAKDTR